MAYFYDIDDEEEKKKRELPQASSSSSKGYFQEIEEPVKQELEVKQEPVKENVAPLAQQPVKQEPVKQVEQKPKNKIYGAINNAISFATGKMQEWGFVGGSRGFVSKEKEKSLQQKDFEMTSGFSGENIPVVRNEMLKTNARDHIEYLDKVQKEVEELKQDNTLYLAKKRKELKESGQEFDARQLLEYKQKRLKEIALEMGYFSKEGLKAEDIKDITFKDVQAEGLLSFIKEDKYLAQQNITLNDEVLGKVPVDKNVWNQIGKAVKSKTYLPSLLKGREAEFQEDYLLAMEAIQQGASISQLTPNQRSAIIRQTNKDWEKMVDRGLLAEAPQGLSDMTGYMVDLAIATALSGGSPLIAGGVEQITSLPKTVQRVRANTEDQFTFIPIDDKDGFRIMTTKLGTGDDVKGTVSALAGGYIETAVELLLGEGVDKLLGAGGTKLASSGVGKKVLEAPITKKLGESFVVKSISKVDNFLKNSPTAKFILQSTGLDSIAGEIAEELVQDMTNSITSGDEYEISTDYIADVASHTALLTFIAGSATRLGGAMTDAQTQAFVNEVNDNKQAYGLPENAELTPDGKVVDTTTGEDITSGVLDGSQIVDKEGAFGGEVQETEVEGGLIWEYGAEDMAAVPNEPIAFLLDHKNQDWSNAKATISFDVDNETQADLGYKITLQDGTIVSNPESAEIGGSPYFETMEEAEAYAEKFISKQVKTAKQEQQPKAKEAPQKFEEKEITRKQADGMTVEEMKVVLDQRGVKYEENTPRYVLRNAVIRNEGYGNTPQEVVNNYIASHQELSMTGLEYWLDSNHASYLVNFTKEDVLKLAKDNKEIAKETKPKTQKKVTEEKVDKEDKKEEKKEPTKKEQESKKEDKKESKPKEEKAEKPKVAKASKEAKVETKEEVDTDKTAQLESKAQAEYEKTWDKLTPQQQHKVLMSLDDGQRYIKTTDQDTLVKLGKGVDILSLKDTAVRDRQEIFLWGGEREGLYTDGMILITDKPVVKKIIDKFQEQYITKNAQLIKRQQGIPLTEAKEGIRSAFTKQRIEDMSFPETQSILDSAKANHKLTPIGFYADETNRQSGSIIFRAENGTLVRLSGKYYSAIKSFYPSVEFYITDESNVKPISFMVGKSRKGIVMPMMLPTDATLTNLVGKEGVDEAKEMQKIAEEKRDEEYKIEKAKELKEEDVKDDIGLGIQDYIYDGKKLEQIPTHKGKIGYLEQGTYQYNKDTGKAIATLADGRGFTFDMAEIYDRTIEGIAKSRVDGRTWMEETFGKEEFEKRFPEGIKKETTEDDDIAFYTTARRRGQRRYDDITSMADIRRNLDILRKDRLGTNKKEYYHSTTGHKLGEILDSKVLRSKSRGKTSFADNLDFSMEYGDVVFVTSQINPTKEKEGTSRYGTEYVQKGDIPLSKIDRILLKVNETEGLETAIDITPQGGKKQLMSAGRMAFNLREMGFEVGYIVDGKEVDESYFTTADDQLMLTDSVVQKPVAIKDEVAKIISNYKSLKDFKKDFMVLYHGGQAEIIGEKLSTGGRVAGTTTVENLGKGQDMGGIFFTSEKDFASIFTRWSEAGAGKVHNFLVETKNMFDVRNPEHYQMLKDFVGRKYKDVDGEELVFTEQLLNFMVNDGIMDWATFDIGVIQSLGFNGAVVTENSDYDGKSLMTYVLFDGGKDSRHWLLPDEIDNIEDLYKHKSILNRNGIVQPDPRELQGVESPFENSIVKDIVYHGTNNQFDKFTYEFMGQTGTADGYGFYFTDKQSIAEMYYDKDKGRLIKARINIQKPLSNDRITMTKSEVGKLIRKLDPTGEDILANFGDYQRLGYESVLNMAVEQEFEYNENDVDLVHDIMNIIGRDPERFYPVLTELLGYDGIVNEKTDTETKEKFNVYVVFSNNQIIKEQEVLKAKEDESKGSQSLETYEAREVTQAEQLKMSDEVKALVHKYADKVGEKYLPRGVLGVFYGKTKEIRLKGITDLYVASHEISHAIDKKYDITARITPRDSVDMQLREAYINLYPTAKETHAVKTQKLEGFAMAVATYIQRPSSFTQEYPVIVKEMFTQGGKYYNTEIGEYLNDVSNIVSRYQSLNDLDRVATRISKSIPTVEQTLFKSKTEATVNMLQNDLNLFERWVKENGDTMTKADFTNLFRFRTQVKQIYENNIATNLSKKNVEAGEFKNFMGGLYSYIRKSVAQDTYYAYNPETKNIEKKYDFNWGTLRREIAQKGVDRQFNSLLVARRAYYDFEYADKLKAEIETIKADLEKQQDELIEMYQKKEGDRNKRDEKAKEVEIAGTKVILQEVESNLADVESLLRNDGWDRRLVTDSYLNNQGLFEKELDMFDKLVAEDILLAKNVGIISQEKYNELKDNKGYAPFKRIIYDEVLGEVDPSEISGNLKLGSKEISSLKKRTGSTKEIIYPLQSAMRNHMEFLNKSVSQDAINTFLTDRTMEMHSANIKKVEWHKGIENQKDIIIKMEDGVRKAYAVDPMIKELLSGYLSPKQVDLLEKVQQSYKQLFTMGTTGTYFPFVFTNLPRDAFNYITQTYQSSSIKAVYNLFADTAKVVLGKNPDNNLELQYFQKYLALGGREMTFVKYMEGDYDAFTTFLRQEEKGLKKIKNAIGKVAKVGLDVLSMPSQLSEMWYRSVEFIEAKKSGDSDVVALEKARRVTTPFHHRGSFKYKDSKGNITNAPNIPKYAPFQNASLQAFAWSGGNFIKDPKIRSRMLLMVGLTTAIGLEEMLRAWKNADDDDKEQFKDLTAEDLSRFIHIPKKGGGIRRIAVAEWAGGIAGTINMAVMDFILEDDVDYSVTDYTTALTTSLPDQFNLLPAVVKLIEKGTWDEFGKWGTSLLPALANPIIAIMGYKTYPEFAPLESSWQKTKLPADRYNEGTSKLAKWAMNLELPFDKGRLGDLMNLSPLQLDAILTQSFGRTIGMITGKPDAWNVLKSVNREYYFEYGRRLNDYWDTKEKNDQLYNSMTKGTREYSKEKELEVFRRKAISKDIDTALDEYKQAYDDKDIERIEKTRARVIDLVTRYNDNPSTPEMEIYLSNPNAKTMEEAMRARALREISMKDPRDYTKEELADAKALAKEFRQEALLARSDYSYSELLFGITKNDDKVVKIEEVIEGKSEAETKKYLASLKYAGMISNDVIIKLYNAGVINYELGKWANDLESNRNF